MPKVSIIVPCYNRIKYTKEAIQSIFDQTFTDWELIIINDFSEENFDNVINEYKKDPRVHYIKNERNLGIPTTRNLGLRIAKGEYIAPLDNDDIWLDKNKLEEQVRFLDQNKEYALISTQMKYINSEGKIVGNPRCYKTTDFEIKKNLLLRNQFIQSGILFRKDVALEVGGYNEKYNVWEDYDLWLRMGKHHRMANLNKYSTGYRIHPGSISQKKKLSNMILLLNIIKNYKRDYPNYIVALIKGYLRITLSLI